VIAALLIVDDAKVLAVVIVPVLLFLLLFALPSIDDVACVAIVVDGAASVHVSLSATLAPVPTNRLPTSGRLTSQKGSVAFLVVINSCYHHQRFDPSDDRCG